VESKLAESSTSASDAVRPKSEALVESARVARIEMGDEDDNAVSPSLPP
jgi:hypothetical protein